MKYLATLISIIILFPVKASSQNFSNFQEIPSLYSIDTIPMLAIAGFKSITEKEFLNYKANQINKIEKDTTIKPDTTGLFRVYTKHSTYELRQSKNYTSSYSNIGYYPQLRAHLIEFTGAGIGEMYLLDDETDDKMTLPSSYDAGIIDLLISPLNQWLLVYSSYDRPDYDSYYDNRSEFFIYKIEKNKGLKGLKPFKYFESDDWSIEEMVWADDKTIALKIYEGIRGEGSQSNGYKFYKNIFE